MNKFKLNLLIKIIITVISLIGTITLLLILNSESDLYEDLSREKNRLTQEINSTDRKYINKIIITDYREILQDANYSKWITLKDGERISNTVLRGVVIDANRRYESRILEQLQYTIPTATHTFSYSFNDNRYRIYLYFDLYRTQELFDVELLYRLESSIDTSKIVGLNFSSFHSIEKIVGIKTDLQLKGSELQQQMNMINENLEIINQFSILSMSIFAVFLILISIDVFKIYKYKNFESFDEGKNYYKELKILKSTKIEIKKKEKSKELEKLKLKKKSDMMKKLNDLQKELESRKDKNENN